MQTGELTHVQRDSRYLGKECLVARWIGVKAKFCHIVQFFERRFKSGY